MSWFTFLPPWLTVYLIGLLPIIDRTAIPLGVTTLNMNVWVATLFFILGNISASIIILYSLDPISKFLRKHSKWMDRFFEWLFERTRNKHNQKMKELGHIALLLFVAVPIPGSGAWVGALVAYLFGVRKSTAITLISAGLIIAALLIALGTMGVIAMV